MITQFASKLTDNKFSFHLVGFNQNVLYDRMNYSLVLTEASDNTPITILATEEDLDYDTFILVAHNLLIDIISMSN